MEKEIIEIRGCKALLLMSWLFFREFGRSLGRASDACNWNFVVQAPARAKRADWECALRRRDVAYVSLRHNGRSNKRVKSIDAPLLLLSFGKFLNYRYLRCLLMQRCTVSMFKMLKAMNEISHVPVNPVLRAAVSNDFIAPRQKFIFNLIVALNNVVANHFQSPWKQRMPSEQIQSQALQSIGVLLLVCIVLLGLWTAFLGFAPHGRSRKVTLVAAFTFWIAIIAGLVWFAFDPAIRAMKFINSPTMFAVIGLSAGVLLFALRRVRKDIYGLLEIGVAIATLVALGRKYDAQSEITVIIGFVGAIYVVVRGLTNISEQWLTPTR